MERVRHRLTAVALDLEDEADRLRRDQERDARQEARHVAGLREGMRVWCLAERRLLTPDDVAFRPAPAQQ